VNQISWAEIEAECGGFRDGFVATFRKYEGQDTDEKTAQGRTVKVTIASFARHMGIHEDTLNWWIRKSEGRAARPTERTAVDRVRQGARNLPSEEKAAIVDELVEADPVVAAAASRALEKRNAELPKPRARERTKSDRYSDALTAMRAADTALDRFTNAVSGAEWSAVEADSFETILARWSGAIELIRAGLRSGTWDDELAKLTGSL
jgi:transposase-like protein